MFDVNGTNNLNIFCLISTTLSEFVAINVIH